MFSLSPQQRGNGRQMLSWMSDANCLTADPALFHPDQQYRNCYAKAVTICGDCSVRQECLSYALANMGDDEFGRHGVWGATTPTERLAA